MSEELCDCGNVSRHPERLDAERPKKVCAGCGRPKSPGPIVCWACFKGHGGLPPLKYHTGSFAQWLALCNTETFSPGGNTQ